MGHRQKDLQRGSLVSHRQGIHLKQKKPLGHPLFHEPYQRPEGHDRISPDHATFLQEPDHSPVRRPWIRHVLHQGRYRISVQGQQVPKKTEQG